MMLIYAALLSIPDEIIEAAECDGITGMAQFWKIKLPLILPTIGIISILTFVGNFNAFDLIYVVAGRAGRARLLDRYSRHLPLPHLLRLPAPARRPAHGRDRRHVDVPDHPGRRVLYLFGIQRACVATSSEGRGRNDQAAPTASLPRALAAHAILIAYTVIALFPVFVIVINSFKTRKAIFRAPLSLPDGETFSLIGYETVLRRRATSSLYFQNSLDRHRRLAGRSSCCSAPWPPSRCPSTAFAATR